MVRRSVYGGYANKIEVELSRQSARQKTMAIAWMRYALKEEGGGGGSMT